MFRMTIQTIVAVAAWTLVAAAPLYGQGAQPAPAAEPEAPQLVTIAAAGIKASEASVFFSNSGFDVTFKGKAGATVITLVAEEEPIETVLNKLAAGYGWQWVQGDAPNSYVVMDQATFVAEVLPTWLKDFIIRPKNLKASEVAAAIEGMLDKKISESVSAADHTNTVFVRCLPQTYELIQKRIEEVDEAFTIRVFQIRYANVEEVAAKLEELKSEPGSIEVDLINKKIIVRDLYANILKMMPLVEIYDTEPEIRVYPVYNLYSEEGDIEDLIDVLTERILTETAYIQVNRNAGFLVVQDVPWVQEKVAQLLEVFDAPMKQAVIHMEILETSFNRGFNYGIQVQGSREFQTAIQDGLFPTRTGSSTPVTTDDTDDETDTNGSSGGTGSNFLSTIPVVDIAKKNFGFQDFHKEFPIFKYGGTEGLAVEYLTEQAHFLFNAAISNSETRVLSQPRIMVQNKENAYFNVGGQVAYRTTSRYGGYGGYGDTNSSYGSYGTDQRTRDYGLTVDVIINIASDNTCILDISVDNTSVSFREEGSGDPLVDTAGETFETIMRIPSGETRVLAGLIKKNDSKSRSGVPLLSDIPYVGPYLFGNKSKQSDTRNLMVFITPIVVEEMKQKKRPSILIEDITKPIDAMLADEELLPDTTLQGAQEWARQYREKIMQARGGDMTAIGFDRKDATEPLEPAPLPPAIPARTPAGATTDPLPVEDTPMTDLGPTSETAALPTPPAPALGSPTSGPAPLVSGGLEPLDVAKHPEGKKVTDEFKQPRSSYVYSSSGSFNLKSGSGGSKTSSASSKTRTPTITPRTTTATRPPTTVTPTRGPDGRFTGSVSTKEPTTENRSMPVRIGPAESGSSMRIRSSSSGRSSGNETDYR